MPTPYRYTRPVSKNDATGDVASVYAQMNAEFILTDGPLMSLSPAPEVLTATWLLLREAQLAGSAPRIHKEVVAAVISVVNGCRFCVDAHAMLIHAAGASDVAEAVWRGQVPADPEIARLLEWAKATAIPHETVRAARPFAGELAAEYIGTALVTHFINRITDSLLNGAFLPGRLQESSFVRRIAGKALGRTMKLRLQPGVSLGLLDGLASGADPAWAIGSPVGVAYEALRATAKRGGALLGAEARDLVLATIEAWTGQSRQVKDDSLNDALVAFPAAKRPGARLALLAAIAPHQVADVDVAAWRAMHPDDGELIRIVAFGAMAAVERIEAALSQARIPETERVVA